MRLCFNIRGSLVFMARFDLHDLKNQAFLFLREKVKDARLALTDVSRIQILTEEATNAEPWGPETKTMSVLSNAAYELEEYERIVQVLHSRLENKGKRPWRQVYKTLVVLEYLLTHGPGSLLNEFRQNVLHVEELCVFSFIDQQGIDRGLSIRKKADRVLELLNKNELWKEERSRALKISHGIQGFGSKKEIESPQVAIGCSEPQPRLEISGAEDAESESTVLLLDEVANKDRKAEVDVLKNSRVEWHVFEKCSSIPMSSMQSEFDSPSLSSTSDLESKVKHRNNHEHKTEFTPGWRPFKKSLSSPSHFRDTSEWQPFSDLGNKASVTAHLIESPNDLDSELFRISEEQSLTDFGVDVQGMQQHGKTAHKPVRCLFGLPKVVEDSPKAGSSECRPSEQLISQESETGTIESAERMKSANTLKGLGAVDGSTVSEHGSKLSLRNRAKQSQSSSNYPGLPPPPDPNFRTPFQHHVQAPSLIDL